MSLPTSGQISMNDIHGLLGGSGQCSLNDSDFRSLAGKPNNGSEIKISDFRGMSIAREIPSYFEYPSYTDYVGTVHNEKIVRQKPSNRQNLLIKIFHVDIYWSDWGVLHAQMQDGTSPNASPKPWWLGGEQLLGYWYGNGYTEVGLPQNRVNIPPIPGDYTLDIQKIIGGVRHRTDLRDSGDPMWPGWSFKREGSESAYPNTWSIWVEGQNVHSIEIQHRGTSWGGFVGVELHWQ